MTGPEFQKKNSNSWDHGFRHDDQNYFLKKTGKSQFTGLIEQRNS
jgi:hypothetical protein